MKKQLLLLSSLIASTVAFAQTYYVFRAPDQDAGVIESINVATGEVLSSDTALLGGSAIQGFTGAAVNPTNFQTYVIAKNGQTFTLATWDGSTTLTSVAALPDKFAGITFGSDGTLYGITGDGANFPSVLYRINMTSGDTTRIVDVFGGDDGETIAFNSTNGLIYRYGGTKFQTINPTTGDTALVTDTLNSVPNWGQALYYSPSMGNFTLQGGQTVYSLSTAGALTVLGTDTANDYGTKGIFYATEALSVKDLDQTSAVLAYPNPATTQVTFSFENSAIYRARVFNIEGKLVDSFQANGKQITYNLNGLDAGLYSFEMDNGETIITEKVMVK